ncbi:MAG: flagellar biosynthesis protein FlhF [Desulfomonilia bacterium]
MQIRTYTAASMKDALSQVKTELGSDAVIISTREVSDGSYGILTKPMIEVVAAIDYDAGLYKTHIRPLRPTPVLSAEMPTPTTGGAPPGGISDEIIELKKMMKELIAHTGAKRHHDNPLRERLLSRGIRANLVDLLLSKLGEKSDVTSIRELLTQLIRTADAPDDTVWAFLGTTGVGKTTSIAKIAATSVLNEGKRVALITLDTYRIGAVDQARTYAKILNIPFISVTTASEFKDALSHLRSMDRILVDTMGRSPFCDDYILQLKGYFEGVDACRFLLMPVATRDREMDSITKSFSKLDIRSMIFTKADEASSFGSMITHNLLFRTPISYITTGQRVPEDIEPATASTIVELCLGDMT